MVSFFNASFLRPMLFFIIDLFVYVIWSSLSSAGAMPRDDCSAYCNGSALTLAGNTKIMMRVKAASTGFPVFYRFRPRHIVTINLKCYNAPVEKRPFPKEEWPQDEDTLLLPGWNLARATGPAGNGRLRIAQTLRHTGVTCRCHTHAALYLALI